MEQSSGICHPVSTWPARANLAALDTLTPVLERVQKLNARLDDTVAELGSDVMDAALEGY